MSMPARFGALATFTVATRVWPKSALLLGRSTVTLAGVTAATVGIANRNVGRRNVAISSVLVSFLFSNSEYFRESIPWFAI